MTFLNVDANAEIELIKWFEVPTKGSLYIL